MGKQYMSLFDSLAGRGTLALLFVCPINHPDGILMAS
jgi:hypothetical protein